MKYLVVGLGNPGGEYEETRHNIGFKVLDALASKSNTFFSSGRFGQVAKGKIRGRIVILLKPDTFMNLSGNAVRHWLTAEKIPVENLLIVVDDVAIPFTALRLRAKGSDGGHNGLKSIQEVLGNANYPRLRVGVGNDFPQGRQVEYVLGKWTSEEQKVMDELCMRGAEAIESFVFRGLGQTMTAFNS
jgi:PTH1 family peptidyl-tRNA hydrolase